MNPLIEDCLDFCRQQGFSDVMLCVPFPIPSQEITHWLEQSCVTSIIVPSPCAKSAVHRDTGAIGEILPDGYYWTLPERSARVIAIAGPRNTISFWMARAAFRHGCTWFAYSTSLQWKRERVKVFLGRRVFEKLGHLNAVMLSRVAMLFQRLEDRVLPLKHAVAACRPYVSAMRGVLVTRRYHRALNAPGVPFMPPRDFVEGRVLLVNGNLCPGGAERQVVNSLLGLNHDPRIEVSMLCEHLHDRPNHDFYLWQLEQQGIEVRVLRRLERPSSRSPVARAVKGLAHAVSRLPTRLCDDVIYYMRELIELKPEVVHAWQDATNVKVGIAAALLGVPRVVLSTRNMAAVRFAYYHPYMWPAYRALERLPNVIFVNNSKAGAADYARWLRLPAKRFKVIHNGFSDSNMVRPSNHDIQAYKERMGIPADALVVGGMFRFNEEKDPLLWIRCAALVAEERHDVFFLLLGTGPLEQQMLSSAKSLDLADRLVMPGTEKNAALAIASMDVFLLTSRYEGTPNVAIEAQWLGVPVVSTPAGGTEETLDDGQTGWIVRKRDPRAIAARLRSILDQPALRQAARERGPVVAHERFGIQRMIDETLEVYGYEPGRDECERDTVESDQRSLSGSDVAASTHVT